jgi:hypothetical protein
MSASEVDNRDNFQYSKACGTLWKDFVDQERSFQEKIIAEQQEQEQREAREAAEGARKKAAKAKKEAEEKKIAAAQAEGLKKEKLAVEKRKEKIAAAQAKALRSGKVAAEIAAEAKESNDYTSNFLRQYDKRVWQRLGSELRVTKTGICLSGLTSVTYRSFGLPLTKRMAAISMI